MKKNNSIEILRVVVMIFIVVHHCVVSGLGLNNSLNNTSTYLTNSNVVLAIMNSIVIVAVNVYFLISGYFGIHFKWKKMLKLLGVIIFYSTCVYGVCVVLGLEELSIKKTISYSVLSVRYYWFMIVYMVLMLLSDYINIVLDKVLSEKKIYIKMIIIFAACFCGYGFVFNDGALGINGGYSIVIAIYLYIIGAGIRKYDIGKNIKSRYLIITYIMCAIINSGAVIVLMWLGRGGLAWRMFAYNNPLIVIEAISLFIIFTKIGKEGRISLSIGKLGKYTLAVYLIHSNPLVTTYRFIPVQQYIEKNGIWVMPMSIIIYSIILFMACICIEIIRSKITKLIIKCKR